VKVGSDVRLGGTKIGSVLGLRLDLADYSAVLTWLFAMTCAGGFHGGFPSVLGEQFVAITPGHADKDCRLAAIKRPRQAALGSPIAASGNTDAAAFDRAAAGRGAGPPVLTVKLAGRSYHKPGDGRPPP
jgi:hypothetical protein